MGMKIDNLSSPLLFVIYNLITRIIISLDKTLTQKSKLLQFLRQLLIYVFYVVSHVLHSFPLPIRFPFDTTRPSKEDNFSAYVQNTCINTKQLNSASSYGHASLTDTAIGRAIKQLLTLVSIIPVSSRKYEVVRCIVEKLIDENLKDGVEVLREVNCVVLNDAFGKTLIGLESELSGQEKGFGPGGFGFGRVLKMVKGWGGSKESGAPCGPGLRVDAVFAEKAAAELLWLAQKLVASGGAMGAVEKWGSASNLGWLGLSAEPRVQSSLVRLTAFLVNQANELNKNQQHQTDTEEISKQKQTLLRMLLTWIPLLCQANNGTDAPTLSVSERGYVEKALEEIIDTLPEDEDCQEKVLSLWLHHFAQSPSSDWPNLYNSYIRWCTISRNLLVAR